MTQRAILVPDGGNVKPEGKSPDAKLEWGAETSEIRVGEYWQDAPGKAVCCQPWALATDLRSVRSLNDRKPAGSPEKMSRETSLSDPLHRHNTCFERTAKTRFRKRFRDTTLLKLNGTKPTPGQLRHKS